METLAGSLKQALSSLLPAVHRSIELAAEIAKLGPRTLRRSLRPKRQLVDEVEQGELRPARGHAVERCTAPPVIDATEPTVVGSRFERYGRSIVRLSMPRFDLGLLALVLILTGCAGARVMMPTPNVHLDPSRDFYGGLHQDLQSTEVPLFYVTDRAPEQDEEGKLRYGYERSASVGFGTAVVDLGRNITWEELLDASRTQTRLRPVELELRRVTELVRAPATPIPFKEVAGRIVEEPGVASQRDEAIEAFRRVLVQQLELTPRKEVFIFVHGYNNSFADASFAMAELWHFLGRIGVPIVYTWPAGHPGLFGYTYDRESSEFTVFHLRSVLGLIASYPEVEKIHLIAHSRGTDVALSAVRELTIAARAAGIDPRKRYKIHNLILAAPDLDIEVATQRIVGDRIPLSVDRFTIYTSPEDKAIGYASRLFASPRGRLGTFAKDEMSSQVKATIEYSNANLAFINFEPAAGVVESIGDAYGHSYFRDAPTVASDLVLMLRDDLDAGAPGRPLLSTGHHFWSVPSNYPSVEAAP
jgi:esterase/lipase superfamily enzyme